MRHKTANCQGRKHFNIDLDLFFKRALIAFYNRFDFKLNIFAFGIN